MAASFFKGVNRSKSYGVILFFFVLSQNGHLPKYPGDAKDVMVRRSSEEMSNARPPTRPRIFSR